MDHLNGLKVIPELFPLISIMYHQYNLVHMISIKKKEITKTEKYLFFFTREYTIKTEVYDSKETMYIVKMNNGDKFYIDYDIRMLINSYLS